MNSDGDGIGSSGSSFDNRYKKVENTRQRRRDRTIEINSYILAVIANCAALVVLIRGVIFVGFNVRTEVLSIVLTAASLLAWGLYSLQKSHKEN